MEDQTNKQNTVKVRGKLLRITNLQMFQGAWQIGLQVEVQERQPAPYFNLQSTNKTELEDMMRINPIAEVGDMIEFEADGKIVVGNWITVLSSPEKTNEVRQSGDVELLKTCIADSKMVCKEEGFTEEETVRAFATSLFIGRRR